MFHSIEYLKTGNPKQKLAYDALTQLNIMNDLFEFTPVLCGTIPIGIDIEGSDLDIITEVSDFLAFAKIIKNKYGTQNQFKLAQSIVRNCPVVTVNFIFKGFEIEIFGQALPVFKQNAYLHMIIENFIMEKFSWFKQEIIKLKKQGYKTEPAFCKILGLDGDPYEALLQYGRKIRLI
jgi:Domain of unknown function (DUF4269)